MPGTRGRIVAATLDTVADAIDMYVARASAGLGGVTTTTGGGLRGGHFVVGPHALRLHGAVYVPGVTVSGTLRVHEDGSYAGPLRVNGPERWTGP